MQKPRCFLILVGEARLAARRRRYTIALGHIVMDFTLTPDQRRSNTVRNTNFL